MHLVYTLLDSKPKKNKDILYLGDWCLNNNQLNSKSHLEKVIPHPFLDIKKKNEAIYFCKKFYEIVLPILSKRLNKTHKINEKNKYWEILFGSWLIRYIEILYERFSCIKNSIYKHGILTTNGIKNQTLDIPLNTENFIYKSFEDEFNANLFYSIIKELDIKVIDNFTFKRTKNINRSFKISVKNKVIKFFHGVNNFIGLKFIDPDYWIDDIGISKAETLWFAKKSNYLFYPFYFEIKSQNIFQNIKLREKLFTNEIFNTSDSFSKIFFKSLSSNLPLIFLEGFDDLKKIVKPKLKKSPKAIISTTSWFFNDYFKLIAAEMNKKNTKLIAVQHGGVEGIGRYESEEDHLVSICDQYITWGKFSDNLLKKKSMPIPKLSLIKKLKYNPSNKIILFLNTTFPKYTYVLHSSPIAGDMKRYRLSQYEFFESLNQNIRDKVVYRKGKQWYETHGYQEHLFQYFTDIKRDNEDTKFLKTLNNSRIAIIDNRQTTYIEAFILNHPTILFWNKNDWEIRGDAMAQFNKLEEVGILFYNASEAAEQLNDIYDNVEDWWFSEKIQLAKNQFLNRLTYRSEFWQTDWIKTFKNKKNKNL